MRKVTKTSAYRKCEWNIRETVEQEEKISDEVETVREFTYLGECS